MSNVLRSFLEQLGNVTYAFSMIFKFGFPAEFVSLLFAVPVMYCVFSITRYFIQVFKE